MIDKRFVIYKSLFEEMIYSAKLADLDSVMFLTCYDSGMGFRCYLWQCQVNDRSTCMPTLTKRFSTYLEAEKWLREIGCLC